MKINYIFTVLLISSFLFGCLSSSQPEDNENEVQTYIQVYYSFLGNGTKSMESGNYNEAYRYFTASRNALSNALEQLNVGCGANVYPNQYCQGGRADILNCKMEVVNFYENSNKLLDVSNPELNCNATMASLRIANIKCTTIREEYPGLLDEWKNLTAPEKIATMCYFYSGNTNE